MIATNHKSSMMNNLSMLHYGSKVIPKINPIVKRTATIVSNNKGWKT